MGTERDYSEMLTVTFETPMPYEWSAGLWGSLFFREIREHGRFTGIRCPKCGKVYVPPRRVCGPCFEELHDVVPLGDMGTIVAFSTVNYPFVDPATGSQRPIPYTYGYIKIDGADNIFSHIHPSGRILLIPSPINQNIFSLWGPYQRTIPLSHIHKGHFHLVWNKISDPNK